MGEWIEVPWLRMIRRWKDDQVFDCVTTHRLRVHGLRRSKLRLRIFDEWYTEGVRSRERSPAL